jgi:flagellar basal-body rod modification protein FlgD
MDVLPSTTRPDPNATRTSAASQVPEDKSVITSDFEAFLKLLTTQMKNQDPLNPMESQEFATQLATFSGVEQQVRTNELLEALSSGFGTLGMGQLGDWIGMEAMAQVPAVFTGDPIAFQSNPASGAERTELVVTDTDGNVMQRMPIPLTDATMEWAGTAGAGRTAPARGRLEQVARQRARPDVFADVILDHGPRDLQMLIADRASAPRPRPPPSCAAAGSARSGSPCRTVRSPRRDRPEAAPSRSALASIPKIGSPTARSACANSSTSRSAGT